MTHPEMNPDNREDRLSLSACDGEPPTILNMSARDLEHPDILQLFLQLAERRQFRLVVDGFPRVD
jgi:hypothetical protein